MNNEFESLELVCSGILLAYLNSAGLSEHELIGLEDAVIGQSINAAQVARKQCEGLTSEQRGAVGRLTGLSGDRLDAAVTLGNAIVTAYDASYEILQYRLRQIVESN